MCLTFDFTVTLLKVKNSSVTLYGFSLMSLIFFATYYGDVTDQ